MTRFMGSQDSIYLLSFVSFSAVVSEICLLNGKKNNLEIYSFQFITSPSHITYCVVLQCKQELSYGHMFTLTKLKLRKQQTESIISDFLIYTSNGKPCIAIPIYTVLPFCVINKQYLHHSFTDYIHMYIYLLYFAWANQTQYLSYSMVYFLPCFN